MSKLVFILRQADPKPVIEQPDSRSALVNLRGNKIACEIMSNYGLMLTHFLRTERGNKKLTVNSTKKQLPKQLSLCIYSTPEESAKPTLDAITFSFLGFEIAESYRDIQTKLATIPSKQTLGLSDARYAYLNPDHGYYNSRIVSQKMKELLSAQKHPFNSDEAKKNYRHYLRTWINQESSSSKKSSFERTAQNLEPLLSEAYDSTYDVSVLLTQGGIAEALIYAAFSKEHNEVFNLALKQALSRNHIETGCFVSFYHDKKSIFEVKGFQIPEIDYFED